MVIMRRRGGWRGTHKFKSPRVQEKDKGNDCAVVVVVVAVVVAVLVVVVVVLVVVVV